MERNHVACLRIKKGEKQEMIQTGVKEALALIKLGFFQMRKNLVLLKLLDAIFWLFLATKLIIRQGFNHQDPF
jgi:hypothetical protein